MNTKFAISKDGAKIAYEVCGRGSAVVLLHGSGRDKTIWAKCGWVEELAKDHTVIAIDIRGWGESDKSYVPEFYSITNIVDDVEAVASDCGFSKFSVFGHSYGATIALQINSRSAKVSKVVCAGTMFGDLFFRRMVPMWIKEYERYSDLKKEGRLYDSGLEEDEIAWAENEDFALMISQMKSWESWPIINPKDVKKDLAIYTGTNDTLEVLDDIKNREEELTKLSIKSNVFEGIDHVGLIEEIDQVLHWVRNKL